MPRPLLLLVALSLAPLHCATAPAAPRPPALPARHADAGWTALAGPLFAGGPHPEDVFQGHLEDCALLAHLTALAAMRPELLVSAVHERQDGRFEVRFPSPSGTSLVVVDRLVPTKGGRLLFAGEAPAAYVVPDARGEAAANARPIWPMILEKAFALRHGGYAALDEELFDAPRELTGWGLFTVWLKKKPPEVSLKILRRALEEKLPVTLGNADPDRARPLGLKALHGYAVVGAFERNGALVLKLRNPSGEARPPLAKAGAPSGEVELEAVQALQIFRFLGTAAPDTRALQRLYDGRD